MIILIIIITIIITYNYLLDTFFNKKRLQTNKGQ